MKEYTIKVIDLSKLFNVTNRTIISLFHSGELPGIKIGGSLRFNKEDVQAYLDKQSNFKQEKRA